jgi:hypothetical protein
MISRKQLIANRRNAKKSTGPRSKAGKRIASKNHLQHGMRSGDILQPFEDRHEFEQHCVDTRKKWDPQGREEEHLVETITAHTWRMKRLHRIQTFRMHQASLDGVNAPRQLDRRWVMYTAIAALATLARYDSEIARDLGEAMLRLERLQLARRGLISREQKVPVRTHFDENRPAKQVDSSKANLAHNEHPSTDSAG